MKLESQAAEVVRCMTSTGISTAGALAVAAGVSRSSAAKVLRGDVVSLSVASKIAEAIAPGTPLIDLFAVVQKADK